MNVTTSDSQRAFCLRHIFLLALAFASCARSTPPANDAKSAGTTTWSAKQVIAGRPVTQTMPNGCTPAGLKFQCNPVTNAGCDSAKGEACDDDEHDGFGCYPAPNTVEEGGACNDQTGPACRGGMGCDTGDDDDPEGLCHKYCCSDADCGGKRCQTIDATSGTLGLCS